jgi:hypothetical protein
MSMMNDKPCDGCQHFDPIMRGNNRGLRETKWAWCAVHSIYPHKEGPGQRFPDGVKRVSDPDKPAQPKIIRKGEVVTNCLKFQEKRRVLSKADLLQKLKDQTQGGRLS